MTNNDLAFSDATELARLIREKKVSPVEVLETYLGRIEALNPKLNAYLTVTGHHARQQAKEAGSQLSQANVLPPLHGVLLAVKDLEFTRGIRTTGGSHVYKDFVPDQDAIIVERLSKAGCIILGKTNTPEFGQSTTTENKLGDDCRNPWDTARTTGGSSGGSAAAIAAGLAPIATGSDGGGSIRVPSAHCGVYGIKPTHGRVPSATGFAHWSFFSHPGPITRSVRDAALMLSVISGYDSRDPFSLREAPPDFMSALQGDLKGLRAAWSPDLGYAVADEEVLATTRKAAELFQDFGCALEEASPGTGEPYGIFATFVLSETYADLSPLLPDHADDFMPYVRKALERGKEVTGVQLAQALRELWRFRAGMRDFFEEYDLLLCPVTAVPAFPIGQRPAAVAGQKVSKLWGATPFTPPFNLTGNPAASVPCGYSSDGLPIGLQVVGRLGEEVTVLRASALLEEALPWAHKVPELAKI